MCIQICDCYYALAYYFYRYKLWKPYLRAVMERDMKAVSEGTKSKAEVLTTSLQQMKACFVDVSRQFTITVIMEYQ